MSEWQSFSCGLFNFFFFLEDSWLLGINYLCTDFQLVPLVLPLILLLFSSISYFQAWKLSRIVMVHCLPSSSLGSSSLLHSWDSSFCFLSCIGARQGQSFLLSCNFLLLHRCCGFVLLNCSIPILVVLVEEGEINVCFRCSKFCSWLLLHVWALLLLCESTSSTCKAENRMETKLNL